MPHKIHIGRKEAYALMRPYGRGRKTLDRWIREVPGLHVTLTGCTRGHILRARLMELLNNPQA